jgi:hypothetical protein
MRPFDFIITFFSFIYSLGLTHILFAATRMIRHRKRLVFSWPLALWMGAALLLLSSNWLSFWDFHQMASLSIWAIIGGFALVVGMYAICALVTPDVDGEDGLDMRAFYERQRPTFLVAFMVLMVIGLVLNWGAGAAMGVTSWSDQNLAVVPMTLAVLPPMLTRRPWVQVASPLVLIATLMFYTIHYYPTLQ